MARQQITTVITTDDLDGSKDAKTLKFDLGGITHTVDLCEPNATELRKALAILRPILAVSSLAPSDSTEHTMPARPAPAVAPPVAEFRAKPEPKPESFNTALLAQLMSNLQPCDEDTLVYSQLQNRFSYGAVAHWAAEQGIVSKMYVFKNGPLSRDVYVAFARVQSEHRHRDLLRQLSAQGHRAV